MMSSRSGADKDRHSGSRSGKQHKKQTRNRIIAGIIAVILVVTMILSLVLSALAAGTSGSRTVREGITLNGMDISGWTQEQVTALAQSIVDERKSALITLCGATDGQTAAVTAENLGLYWTNEEEISGITEYGHAANIIARYKQEKDLEAVGADFTIEVDFSEEQIRSFIESNCLDWNEPAVEASMTRANGGFVYYDGSDGIVIDEDASVDRIYTYLTTEWTGGDTTITLEMETQQPSTTVEDLQQLTSVLGTFTTSYSTSNTARSANIANACAMIDGVTLGPGETFSVLDTITPFTEENGYQLAGSYVGNELVDSFGGGICQVSTTLYNAVIRAELTVNTRYCHSMIVHYVDPSADAAIAESSGMDFRFTNNLDQTVYIEGYTGSGTITFTIYGVETRASNRSVSFESETLTETPSEGITVKEDASLAVGTVEVTEGYTGYTARLWKIVTIDGVEESREIFNNSTYNMTPTTVTVGTAGNVTDELREAMEAEDLEAIQTAAANAAAASTVDTDALTRKAQEAADAAYAAALAEGKDTTTALEEAQEAANAVVSAAASAETSDSGTDASEAASEGTSEGTSEETTAETYSDSDSSGTDDAQQDTSGEGTAE